MSFAKKLECPMCRSVPIASPGDAFVVGDRIVQCHVSRECPPGITLANEGKAVRVVRVKKNDAAQRGGLRANDRIVSINSLPCRSHAEAVRVWEAILAHAKTIDAPVVASCVVERPSLWRTCF